MKALRILLKNKLTPIILALTLVVSIGRFLTGFSTVLLNIVSGLLFLLGVCMIFILRQPFSEVWRPFFMGWLLSPYGLPLLAGFLVELVDVANAALKSV